jgi:dipeptidyl aminopeptidase/acylaminoacyl peptidase
MPDVGNPFRPGQPVNSASLFFGRHDAIAWIRENLVKGRRLMLISGSSRVGKTSLLLQVTRYLPDTYTALRVEMLDEDAAQLDHLLWHLAGTVGQQLNAQLGITGPQPAWSDFEGHPESLLDGFWPRLRAALGHRDLLLMLDDADALLRHDRKLLAPLLAVLERWTAQDANLSVILTLTPQEPATGASPQLPGHLPVFQLGPLPSEDAIRLLQEPVGGIITYDYGVARRLVEITSGQPYYLQLLCFEIFNRCAAAGWVNQRDVDAVVGQLVQRDIPDFQQIWHESSPQEQAVLAAFVSLRGARGVATALELHTILTNTGVRVERSQVAEILDQLAARGILERLGALSYRFRLMLLSDWLRQRVDLPKLARGTRWKDREHVPVEPPPELLARPRPARSQPEDTSPAAEQGQGQQDQPVRRAWWPWLLAGLVTLVLLGSLALAFWPRPAEPTPTPGVGDVRPTALRPAATLPSTTTPLPGALLPTLLPTVAASATPKLTPTPTPPVIVSHPLPAIAYQSLPHGAKNWAVYVMDSNGANPLRLTDEQSNAISPAWSPDGTKIAFVSNRDGNFDIWVMSSDGSNPIDLTHNPAQDRWPAWSPDGEWIAFASVRDSPYWELYIMRADGSDVRRVTWWQDASDVAPAWSPDGKWLAFASRRDGNWEIYVVDRDGGNLVRLTVDPADDTNPTWSPDGRRIAFESTRTGYADIFAMPAAGGDPVNLTKTPFSSDHGPTWSPDGGRLAFYSDRDGEWDIYVMAADGSNAVNLTGDGSDDEVPAWRP